MIKPKILFVGEAVSLAHVTRPLTLARALDPSAYDLHFACDPRFDFLFKSDNFKRWPIHSITCEQFNRAVEKGTRLFPTQVLREYVKEELQLIKEIKPDLVVGDFRLSLSVSTKLTGVPYVSICNAHWSPYVENKRFPLPNWSLISWLGSWIEDFFAYFQPLVFSFHAAAINTVRKEYNLPQFKDFLESFTYGDYVLYADTPGFVPLTELPPNHHHLGPVSWSPDIDYPSWWPSIVRDKPIVYLTLGSTGDTKSLSTLVRALEDLPITVLVATAGRMKLESRNPNIKIADYLPGDKASELADLVVCNGGSATVYAALRKGVPVLGIASNMDQLVTMGYVEKAKAGKLIRSHLVSLKNIQDTVKEMLSSEIYFKGAKEVAKDFAAYDSTKRFRESIQSLTEKLLINSEPQRLSLFGRSA